MFNLNFGPEADFTFTDGAEGERAEETEVFESAKVEGVEEEELAIEGEEDDSHNPYQQG